MALFGRKPEASLRGSDPNRLLQQAKSGHQPAREEFIRQYTPFALRVASSTCGRYLHLGEDDEASIALIAFNEAIDAYQEGKGASFLTFAEMLIKRRLVDFYRKEGRARRVVSLSMVAPDEAEGETEWSQAEVKQAFDFYRLQGENSDRREEILQYVRVLQEYGIDLMELVELTPKHQDARERAVATALLIAGNEQWRQHLMLRKELPLKELSQHVDVSRKTMERQRKYIIALVLAVTGDFPFLRHYITQGRRDCP